MRFDEPFENAQWRKVKQIQPMQWKGADLFQKGGQTKKQAAGRGTSRYSIGIKSWPELISN